MRGAITPPPIRHGMVLSEEQGQVYLLPLPQEICDYVMRRSSSGISPGIVSFWRKEFERIEPTLKTLYPASSVRTVAMVILSVCHIRDEHSIVTARSTISTISTNHNLRTQHMLPTCPYRSLPAYKHIHNSLTIKQL
jgi:hypothetical protein